MASDSESEAGKSRVGAGIRNWILNHDESWLFIIGYIGLAVVLSIWISLFWLVAVVAVHFVFELLRQQQLRTSPAAVILETLWELKLDMALVLFALVISLYMEVVLGVVGLQSAARAGAATQASLRGGARFAAWQRIIRGVLLSVDDAAQVVRVAGGGGDEAEPEEEEPASMWGGWAGRWGKVDWISISLGLASLALIFLAPFLTHHTFDSAWLTLAAELHPWPIGE